MNKRLLWPLLAVFVLVAVLISLKISRSHQPITDGPLRSIKSPVAAEDFPLPSSPPPSAALTRQDIAKITCPKPLSLDNWLVEVRATKPTELDWVNYNLSNQEKKTISRSYQQGINLAGYYHLASWSCGQDCQKAAVINTKTGRLIAFGATDDLQSKNGWQFSATSSLLVINPNSQEKDNPTIYTLVEDQGLRRICYLAQK